MAMDIRRRARTRPRAALTGPVTIHITDLKGNFMDEKLKKKWVKALRSGKYRQAKGKLCTSTGASHCCLGVLLDVQGADIFEEYPTNEDRETNTLPVEWSAGLSFSTATELANMNDGAGQFQGRRMNFKQIADYIEKYL
jgi:hypothetical protein